MRKIHKSDVMVGACLLSGIILFNSSNFITVSYAKVTNSKSSNDLNEFVIGKVVDGYDILNTYDDTFASYLLKKGINTLNYRTCVTYFNNHKDDKISLLYEIENLLYSFDTILYTDKVVQGMYKNNLETTKDKDKAWNETVKSLIYDTNWLSKVYDENISNKLDIEKLYKYRFKREMSKKELEYAKDPKNLIYILYSGVLGKDLDESNIKLIDKGKGYELLGITATEYKEYRTYISNLKKILAVSEGYVKAYKIHSQVRKNIIAKHKIDIFKELSDADRKMVYEKSLSNYVYDEKKAERVFMSVLDGYSSNGSNGGTGGTGDGNGSGGSGSGEKPPITNDSIINTPVDDEGKEDLDGYEEEEIAGDDELNDEDYEYLEEILKPLGPQSSQIIHAIKSNKYTSAYYSKLGQMINIYNSNRNKSILMVDMGEEKIYTLVEVEGNSISSTDFRTVMNQIVVEGDGKLVESKKEMLLFVNNAIATIEKKEEEYIINKINEAMETVNVKWRVVSLQEAISEYMKEIHEGSTEVEQNEA